MGWLQRARLPLDTECSTSTMHVHEGEVEGTARHVEYARVDGILTTKPHVLSERSKKYPFVPMELPDAQLPFISAEEIRSSAMTTKGSSPKAHTIQFPGYVWIVIDDIVYDCSEYITSHPGGEDVMANFSGQDCSWQFWRFHGAQQMVEFGRQLRIGRTTCIKNRWTEPTRWVGLRKLNNLEDW